MVDSKQVRLNELARELEIKAKVLIDYLPEIGVKEKKTHSSSIDIEHAELARKHFLGLAAAEVAAEAAKTAAAKAKTPPRLRRQRRRGSRDRRRSRPARHRPLCGQLLQPRPLLCDPRQERLQRRQQRPHAWCSC